MGQCVSVRHLFWSYCALIDSYMLQTSMVKRIPSNVVFVGHLLTDGKHVQIQAARVDVGDECLTHSDRIQFKVYFECQVGNVKYALSLGCLYGRSIRQHDVEYFGH